MGLAGGFGGGSGCPVDQECKAVTTNQILTYRYARGGLGVAFGSERRHLIAADLGVWQGRHKKTATTSGVTTEESRPITWLVPGLSYYFVL